MQRSRCAAHSDQGNTASRRDVPAGCFALPWAPVLFQKAPSIPTPAVHETRQTAPGCAGCLTAPHLQQAALARCQFGSRRCPAKRPVSGSPPFATSKIKNKMSIYAQTPKRIPIKKEFTRTIQAKHVVWPTDSHLTLILTAPAKPPAAPILSITTPPSGPPLAPLCPRPFGLASPPAAQFGHPHRL